MLFDAIKRELPERLDEDTMEKSNSDIQDAISSMLTDSVSFYPPFIYALEDACFRNENLKLDANAVAVASKASVQHPVGIILLEKQLLDDTKKEPAAKRRHTERVLHEDSSSWIELAKLYKAIDSYDFVHTIFKSEITKQENVKLALESEERNDYAHALKLYTQVCQLL